MADVIELNGIPYKVKDTKSTKIILVIEGGCLQRIVSDDSYVDILILDMDAGEIAPFTATWTDGVNSDGNDFEELAQELENLRMDGEEGITEGDYEDDDEMQAELDSFNEAFDEQMNKVNIFVECAKQGKTIDFSK